MDEHEQGPISNQVILSHMRRRTGRNANCCVLVIGGTGSGKSYLTLDMAALLDPAFSINCCVWNARNFLNLLKLPPLSSLIGDEIGVFMSAREWNSKENKALSKAFQTMRFMNHYVFVTVPKISMVDVHARQLFHYLIICKGKIRGNTNTADVYTLSENPKKIGAFFRNPILYWSKGVLRQATHFYSKLPPAEVVNEYEARRGDKIKKMIEKDRKELGGEEEQNYYCHKCKILNDESICKRCGGTLK